jgi:predicted transposase/invertase (TIGR01784 family)
MNSKKHIRFDWAIKRLLRQKANFRILEGFLSELLSFDVQILEILESEGNQKHVADKFNRVDILVKNASDELILIEVQNEKEDDYFHRMNYGQAKLITEYINLGDEYARLKRIYSINIVYFELGQGKDYIYVGRTHFTGMHTNDTLQLSAKQKELYPLKEVSQIFTTYYLLKINNFNNNARNTLDEWIYFLKNNEIKEEFTAKGLPEANEILRVDKLSKTQRYEYEQFIESERIRAAEIHTAQTDGERKAREELLLIVEEAMRKSEEECRQKEEALQKEKEAKLKLAQKMLKYGEPIEEIMKETGLNREEIEKLK